MDIPLFLENKMYGKDDIIIFIKTRKNDVNKKIRKRPNFNKKLVDKTKITFKEICFYKFINKISKLFPTIVKLN